MCTFFSFKKYKVWGEIFKNSNLTFFKKKNWAIKKKKNRKGKRERDNPIWFWFWCCPRLLLQLVWVSTGSSQIAHLLYPFEFHRRSINLGPELHLSPSIRPRSLWLCEEALSIEQEFCIHPVENRMLPTLKHFGPQND